MYITKEKFKPAFLSDNFFSGHTVLIFEPEVPLLGIYLKSFLKKEFVPHGCSNFNYLHTSINSVVPKVLVFGISKGLDFSEFFSQIVELKNQYKNLPIVSYAYNLSAKEVKDLMDIGVVSHLDRKFSKPQDLVDLVKALVN